MREIIALLATCLFLGACSSHSGQQGPLRADGYEVGNGGIVVVCRGSGGGDTVELLDFYRAKFKLQGDYEFNFGVGSQAVADKIAYALSRLARLDPARAGTYQKQADRFFSRAKFVEQVQLPDTRDYGDLPQTPGCEARQLVVQSQPEAKDGVQFLMQRELWERLDDDRRAAVVIHEVVYEDAIHRGQKDSLNVQTLVALIASTRLDTYTQLDYNQMMVRMGMATLHEQAPVWERSPLALDTTYCAGVPLQIDLRLFASHPAKDLLSFEPVSVPSWLSIDSGGLMHGTPSATDVGGSAPVVRATNGVAYAEVEVRFELVDCSTQPLVVRWRTGFLQHAALPDLSPRVYHRLNGASWLFFNARSGDLSGTPPASALGSNEFLFRASAPGYSDIDVKLEIDVLPKRDSAPDLRGALDVAAGSL